MSNTIERFLRYIKIDTQSDEASVTSPSTLKQHELASLLAAELVEMGALDVIYDREHCYVYASIPASDGYEEKKVLGFIAHMDTSPAVSGKDVKPNIIKNFDGKDIILNEADNIVLKISEFPEIIEFKSKDLIVTDGTTLLGADDKAGIAEIMAMAEYLLAHKECKHGEIRIAFTPDEEIGCGVDYFDTELFGAAFAYTVDGGALGELEYENFNAARAKVTINGRNVHPGYAKNKMINALLVAKEFESLLPEYEKPMFTEGYEGFYHLDAMEGNVEQVTMDYIIRDHNRNIFENRKKLFWECGMRLNQKYGEGTVCIELKDSYYNMMEIMKDNMHLIENAKKAMKELNIKPLIAPVRGGTDGARLSFMGIPCPNLCTGGANYHSRFEYACVQDMEKVTTLLIRLTEIYGTYSQ
ncbi:MAG: peptidase T [Lachnospiraceae bacterium]|nr:peptidase T [Lachnospiraceae bacterium]